MFEVLHKRRVETRIFKCRNLKVAKDEVRQFVLVGLGCDIEELIALDFTVGHPDVVGM